MKTNPFRLPELGYQLADLAPMMSQQTLTYHYGKHFQTYIDNLNRMVNGSHFEGLDIEDVVRKAPEGPMANNAGQVLNHQLFFEQFLPAKNAKMPSGDLLFLIEQSFESFYKMREAMDNAAKLLFGSGWVWLAMNTEGKMQVLALPNGDNPLRHGLNPILTIDLWEHAYYLDYQNRKDKYLENFWLLVNWNVVSKRLL
jgi:Fe-Mn family superoxide dismutase